MLSRRNFIKNCAAAAAILSGSGVLSKFNTGLAAEGLNIPVLCYHRVGDTRGDLTITPDKFATDLSRLREEGYETISLETFRQYRLDPEIPMPDKPLLITFDDGYLDNYLNAFLLLRQYGMTAAFFIITSLVGTPDRLAVGHIREMAAAGMSIGSHTVSHRELGEMGVAEAANEMSLSRLYLEGILQQPIRYIAYPRGSFNESTPFVANESAYWGGFSVLNGTCSRGTNPYILRRIPVFSFDGDIIRTMNKRRYG